MPVRVRADVVVAADDGTALATDIYLPETLPAPVVVTRTPYDRAALRRDGLGWAAAGLVFVAQDVRGRYGSAGCWTPYRGERADGATTIAWALEQQWCSGQVFAVGASYGAFTAWSAAVAAPQSVRGVISLVPAVGPRAINHSEAGVLRLAEHVAWWGEHADARTSRTDLVGPMMADPGICGRLPVQEIGDHLWADVPNWWSAVADGPSATYPNDDGPEAVTDAEMASLSVPTLHIGGWYDAFLPQTLHQWDVMRGGVGPRPPADLVIGPWAHRLSSPGTTSVGDRTHSSASQLPLGRHQVEWIRSVLDPETHATPTELVYLAGDETWLTHWPPATRDVVLHTGRGGSLDVEAATHDDSLSFVYDPCHPYPSTLAGVDQSSHVDNRDDLVRFAGPTDRARTLTGRPRVDVVSSCAAPADRVVILAERREDGALISLADGHVSAPSGTSTCSVTLSPIAVTLPSTSRLELLITGGCFPALARHPQSDECRHRATTLHPAEIAIHTGPDGTTLRLPVPAGPVVTDRATPTSDEE